MYQESLSAKGICLSPIDTNNVRAIVDTLYTHTTLMYIHLSLISSPRRSRPLSPRIRHHNLLRR